MDPHLPLQDFSDDIHFYTWPDNKLLNFLPEDLDCSWGVEDALAYYDSSSPDGAALSAASKNIVSERNRRKKLNERLFALRAVVPNISKMDKASIIKDAIDYIQELQEQQRRIEAEIVEFESGKLRNNENFDQDFLPVLLRSKKKKTDFHSLVSATCPLQLLELRVDYMGEKIVVVRLTCSKRSDTMLKLCQVFESLDLKIITANISTVSDRLLKTLFVEAEEQEKDHLKIKIQTAIAAVNDSQSPMST